MITLQVFGVVASVHQGEWTCNSIAIEQMLQDEEEQFRDLPPHMGYYPNEDDRSVDYMVKQFGAVVLKHDPVPNYAADVVY